MLLFLAFLSVLINSTTETAKKLQITKRAQNGDTLIHFLENNDHLKIDVESSKFAFPLDDITIKDLNADQTRFKFDMVQDVTLAGLITINRGQEINAFYDESSKGFRFTGWHIRVSLDGVPIYLTFYIVAAQNGQDMSLMARMLGDTYPFDDFLKLLGFNSRTDTLNMDGFDVTFINEDLTTLIARISFDDVWNVHMKPNNDESFLEPNNGLLCSKFITNSINNTKETTCAFFKLLTKGEFETFMDGYATQLSWVDLKLPPEDIVFISSKNSFKYSDNSNMKDKIAAIKRNGEYVFSDIIGGNNFFFIKLPVTNIGVDITSELYSKLFFDCKLYREKFEMKLFPQVPIAMNSIIKLLPDGKLKDFFKNDFVSTNVLLENFEVYPNAKLCVTIKFAVAHDIIENKYAIEDTVMQFCQEGSSLKFLSQYNQERNFDSKMMINIANDPAGGQMLLSGNVKIMEVDQLLSTIGESFMSSSYKSIFSNLDQFPLTTLSHQHKLGTNHIRFDGIAVIKNIEFNLQAIYVFSGEMESTSPLSLCLEKKQKKKLESGEEADAPSLRFVDFVEYLYGKQNMGIGTTTRFKKFKISFQQNAQFYASFNDVASLKCLSIADTVINQEDFGSDLPEIFMYASEPDYTCAEGSESEKTMCSYLKNAFNYEENFPGESFYGYLKPNEFKLLSSFPISRAFSISDSLSLEGIDEEVQPLVQVIEWKRFIDANADDSKLMGNVIRGYLTKNNLRDRLRLQAQVQILEEKLLFRVAETPDPRPEIGFLGIANVNEVVLRSFRHEIPTSGEIHLVFHSDLKIGSVAASAITVPGREGLTAQYLYGAPNQNKFYACLENDAERSLTSIFEAFGMSLSQEIFRSITLSNICFTYSPENAWQISSRKITAPVGLWLIAKTKTRAVDVYGKERDFTVSVKIKCDGDDRKIYLELPPLFFYPIPEVQRGSSEQGDDSVESRTVIGAAAPIQEKRFKVSITKAKDSKENGPILEITLTGNTISEALLNGFLSTIAFESPAIFTVNPTNLQDVEFSQIDRKASKRGKEEKILGEGFQINGILNGRNLFQESVFQFKFDGNRLVPQAKESYRQIVKCKQNFYEKKGLNHSQLTAEIQRKLENPSKKASKRSELDKELMEIQRLKRKLHTLEKRKFLPCTKSCKAILSPGFKWGFCHSSKRFGNLSCLQLTRDAIRSGDMACLTGCEVERFGAHEKSQDLFKEITKKASALAKRSIQGGIYTQLLLDVAPAQSALESYMRLYDADNTALSNIDDTFPLTLINTDWVDFEDFSDSTKLDFSLTYNDGQMETVSSVVDGGLPKRLATEYLNKLHGEKFNNIEEKEENVQKSYGNAMKIISDWEITNRDKLKRGKRRRPIGKKAKSKKKKSSSSNKHEYRRAYEEISIKQRPSSLYQEDTIITNNVLRNIAPWNALQRNNPFFYNSPVNGKKRNEIIKSSSACNNRRNEVRDYKEILAYMTTWSDAYENAKNLVSTSQKEIAYGMEAMKKDFLLTAEKRHTNNRTNSQKSKVEEKWMNRLSAGFNTWQNELQRQLSTFHKMGPKIMAQEINSVFTPHGFDSLKQYTRTIDESIAHVGEVLFNGLSRMRSLDENRKFIAEMNTLLGKIEAQPCHEEL